MLGPGWKKGKKIIKPAATTSGNGGTTTGTATATAVATAATTPEPEPYALDPDVANHGNVSTAPRGPVLTCAYSCLCIVYTCSPMAQCVMELDFSVEAPPSILPAKKYCDVTGLEAPYTDPKSMLRYHNAEIYELIRTFVSLKTSPWLPYPAK